MTLAAELHSTAIASEVVVAAADTDLSSWDGNWPLPLKFALGWARFGPRAKGWLPRIIGRHFCSKVKACIRTKNGACLAIDPSTLDTYMYTAAHGGTWEAPVEQVLQRLVRPGDIVYDIGANIGAVALDLAKKFKDELLIYAFEPQANLAKHIAISAKLSSLENIVVFNTLLGDEDGFAKLFIPAHSIHASLITRDTRALFVTCPLVRLDTLWGAGTIRAPDAINIDIEGAEIAVFIGGRQLIQSSLPSIFFEADVNLERFSRRPSDVISTIKSLGPYDIYLIEKDDLISVDANRENLPYGNYLAVSPHHRDRL